VLRVCGSLAAGLRGARDCDAAVAAERQVSFAEGATVCALQVRRASEGLLVVLQRWRDMWLVRRIGLDHLVLRDEARALTARKTLSPNSTGVLACSADTGRCGARRSSTAFRRWVLARLRSSGGTLFDDFQRPQQSPVSFRDSSIAESFRKFMTLTSSCKRAGKIRSAKPTESLKNLTNSVGQLNL
jgi:hypothetical protein